MNAMKIVARLRAGVQSFPTFQIIKVEGVLSESGGTVLTVKINVKCHWTIFHNKCTLLLVIPKIIRREQITNFNLLTINLGVLITFPTLVLIYSQSI